MRETMTVASMEQPVSFNRSSLRWYVPLVAVAVILIGFGAYGSMKHRRSIEWSGTMEARAVSVGSRVGGRVKEVLAKEGDRVKQGDVLVVLEAWDLEAQRAIAEGELEQVNAILDKLERGARPEEIEQANARALSARAAYSEIRAGARREQVQAAAAQLAAAQATADNAQGASDRARALFASQSVSQAHLDRAENGLRAALAERDALQQKLDELEHGVRREALTQAEGRAAEAAASARLVVAGSRAEDIRAARAVVHAAEGRLKKVQLSLDELTIRAPKNARVESLKLRSGDIVGPDAPAATLLEDGQLYARIYVPETQLGFAQVGKEVRLRVDSFPNRSFLGVIEYIDSVGEYTPRNLQNADERANHVFGMRVDLREGVDLLRAGMSTSIEIPR